MQTRLSNTNLKLGYSCVNFAVKLDISVPRHAPPCTTWCAYTKAIKITMPVLRSPWLLACASPRQVDESHLAGRKAHPACKPLAAKGCTRSWAPNAKFSPKHFSWTNMLVTSENREHAPHKTLSICTLSIVILYWFICMYNIWLSVGCSLPLVFH